MNAQTQSNADISQLLSEGKVAFTYTNAAGQTRNALGTTNESLMPTGTKIVQSNNDVVTYYDLNVMGIRTFKRDNLDQSSVSAA